MLSPTVLACGSTRTSAPFATLLVDVPAAHSWTMYQLLGDWFAWVAIALLVFVTMQQMRLRNPAHI